MADGAAELKIVVRAVDATRTVLDGIGRRIFGVLTKPLNVVANAVKGIWKQFFSLKGLLLGGGIVGAVAALTSSLAKNAKTYEPIFSPETQKKIDDTATAFNKLRASLSAVFAEIVVEFKLADHLNALSDWLRDNKDGILKFFRDFGETLRGAAAWAADLFRSVAAIPSKASGPVVPPQYGSGGPGSFDPAKVQRILDEQRARGVPITDRAGLDGPVYGPESFGGRRPTPEEVLLSTFPPGTRGLPPAFDAVINVAPKVEATTRATAAVTAATVEATTATAALGKSQEIVRQTFDEFAASLSTHHGTLTEHVEVIQAAIISTEEYADAVAGNFTDAFFEAVEGTKTFARAFADMTVSILRDIARLLIFRSVFNLVAGALTPSIAAPNAGNIGGAGEAGGVFGAGFEAPYGFAGGGSIRRSGVVSVGEQGRERVFLPRGSRVEPAHMARDGGGVTVNVIGARDPEATAREVIVQLRRNGALRQAVRLA